MLNEIIPLNLSEKWISSLWKQLNAKRKKREAELEHINNSVLYSDPLDLAKVYVEPSCQEVNPADRHDEDHFLSKQPLFQMISKFLAMKSYQQGNNQLFVLSDAGMGKTSSLVMMKLINLTNFWPNEYACHLEKLGRDTLDNLNKIENKRKTILLLDSLDEDPTAYERVEERLLEILNATKTFSKVIITCRTQFFPNHETDPLEVPGRIKIGPFICPSKYLSVFEDSQVEAYLLKRFPKRLLFDSNKEKREKAKSLVQRMGSLRCRPMLLSFIEDLVGTEKKLAIRSEYSLYYALVNNWLIREEGKTGISSDVLLSVCARLAFEMQAKKMVKISPQELNDLIDKFNEIEKITHIDIAGRSLLNRNSDGDYRFSHYSIQEYLVVYFILELAPLDEKRCIYPTDFIRHLLETNTEKVNARFNKETVNYLYNIEATSSQYSPDDKQEYLSEKDIVKFLAQYSDNLSELDTAEFDADVDIPTYLRKIIVKHAKMESDEIGA